jgi:hypothetical protein
MKTPRQANDKSTANAAASLHPPRPHCLHVSRNGRPCRYLGLSPENPFCKDHVPPPPPGTPEALAYALQRAAADFSSPQDVKNVMAKVFCAMLERRLSPKEAGVLCYIAQTILHCQRLSAYFDKVKEQLAKDADDGIPCNFFGDPIIPYRPRPDNTVNTDSASTPASQPATPEESAPPAPAASQTQPAPANSALSSSTSSPPPKPPNLNHFYPRDPALPPGSQDPNRFSSPTPSLEELERRNARFNPAQGSRSSSAKQSYPQHQDAEWKIINGR